MKRILSYIAVPVVAVLMLNSCQKYTYISTVKASVDGVDFRASGKTNVIAHVDTSTHNPQLLRLTATSDRFEPGTSVKQVIEFTVPNVVGTYTIDTSNHTTIYSRVYTAKTGSGGMGAIWGEIQILNIKDGRVQGNFSLICADSTIVTNGQYVAEEGAW